ncbi:MAG: hypothetical protein U1B94_05995 [candidate division NC10 bacterium]|nr:hypothetical protein [candidate division NC10 bacterium]
MRMSSRQRLLFLSVVCASVAVIWVRVATAPAQEKAKERADRAEAVTLQYRVARDAVAPSRFVVVTDKGISAPLDIRWDLPRGEEKKKEEFDTLIKKLEDRQINGVEFECRGEWLKGGAILRVTAVPQLTEKGKKRIREHAP